MHKPAVLFLCTHNSARSQIAEGLLKHLFPDQFEVFSAGTRPTHVHPYAIEVMAEIGIDISKQYSKHLKEFLNHPIDLVITVCNRAKEECPVFPGAKAYFHKGFPDPSDEKGSKKHALLLFRNVRDQIKSWIVDAFTNMEIFSQTSKRSFLLAKKRSTDAESANPFEK